MNWLSVELKNEVREIFEMIYGRKLSNKEVIEIANTLTQTVEIILKSNE